MISQHFKTNMKGRDFVVGDIHGTFSRLKVQLFDIGFDKKVDRLFSVGDLIDRGMESEQSLEWLEYPWFHAVRGNHEQMLIDVYEDKWDVANYCINGGQWFFALGGERQKQFHDAFCKLPLAIEIETYMGIKGIVHADCDVEDWYQVKDCCNELVVKSEPWRQAVKDSLLWSRRRINSMNDTTVKNVHSVYTGHSIVQEPRLLGNVHYIDTGAYTGQPFTILQIC